MKLVCCAPTLLPGHPQRRVGVTAER